MYGWQVGRKAEGVMWARERDKCDIAPREVGGRGPQSTEQQLLVSLFASGYCLEICAKASL